MDSVRKVVIVGGGPGGLAAAHALHTIGLEVVVVERSGEQDRTGVGITLWPNGTKALEQLGVLGAVRRQAAAMAAMAMRTDRDRILFSLDLNSQAVPPYPSLALTRTALIDCLRDGLEVPIVHGNVGGFSVENDRVVVKLENGREIEADYLVGADGEHSIVRRQLFGPSPGRHAGYVVWRGVAAVQPYGASGISWLGRGVQFGAFPLPGRQTYWFATALTASDSPASGDSNKEIRALFADWPAPIRDIIGATSPARLVLTHPLVYPRLVSWTSGLVALVGDAAHPLEPTLGQGACLAFEDAVVLTASLQAHPELHRAWALYGGARRKRAERLAAQAHILGLLAKWRSGMGCSLRNLAIAATPGALHRRQIATMFTWAAPPQPDPWPGGADEPGEGYLRHRNEAERVAGA